MTKKKGIKHILVVCAGNSDRSPAAEALIKEYSKKYRLDLKVSSFGMNVGKPGKAASKGMTEVLVEKGITSIKKHKARPITDPDVLKEIFQADLILTATHGQALSLKEVSSNIPILLKGKYSKEQIKRIQYAFRKKIYTLKSWSAGRKPSLKSRSRVLDPYGRSKSYFKRAAEAIDILSEATVYRVKYGKRPGSWKLRKKPKPK